MIPIPTWSFIIEKWDELFAHQRVIFACLLYAKVHAPLYNYFLDPDKWNYMHSVLSNNKCFVFSIEKPPKSGRIYEGYNYSEYYEQHSSGKLQYSEDTLSSICQNFGIGTEKLPCMVFFTDIFNREKKLVIIQFTKMTKFSEKNKIDELTTLFGKIFDPLSTYEIDTLRSVKREREKMLELIRKKLTFIKLKKYGIKIISGTFKAGKSIKELFPVAV